MNPKLFCKQSQLTTSQIRRLFRNKTFIRNFLTMAIILLSIFLIFSVIIFSMFKNELNQEHILTSQSKLNESSQAIDSHISEVHFAISYLENNNMIRAFLFHQNPENIYSEFFERIHSLLNVSVRSLSFIDSIYLYSYNTGAMLSNDNLYPQDVISDDGWTSLIDKDDLDFQSFFRKKHNVYPHLLTIAKSFRSGNSYGAIIVNIDLRNLSTLSNLNSNTQSIYLVSNTGQILYSVRQSHLDKQAQTIPELIDYKPSDYSIATLIRDGDTPSTYAQTPSQSYPWNYVLVTHLSEYNRLLTDSTVLIVVMAFALIAAGSLLAFFLSMRSLQPINDLIMLLENPESALSTELLSNQEIQEISTKILHYINTNQALTDELSSKLTLLNKTKLLALQAQINPHFLFNTLNMIYIGETDALGYSHPVPKLTIQLSRLLRYAIESTDLVSLSTELEFTKTYINLLQQRYRSKPKVIYDISEHSLQANIPKLTIQPIVENAIFHGLAKQMNDNSTLTISCHVEEAMCVLIVADNGIGMSPEVLHNLEESLKETVPLKNSIGLKNIVTRMQLIYGEDFSISIESEPCFGSKFTLTFPMLGSSTNLPSPDNTPKEEISHNELTI